VSRATGSASGGGPASLIDCEAFAALPFRSVTVTLTVYVPEPPYVCVAVRVGSDVVMRGEPSPKSKRKLRSDALPACDPDASAVTVNGGLPACVSASFAVGPWWWLARASGVTSVLTAAHRTAARASRALM